MDSTPPATIKSASPAMTACAASATAFKPDPHTLLTVNEGTASGIPAAMAACRAGFMPPPACSTLPIMTSSMSALSMPLRWIAPSMTTRPSSLAGTSLSAPPKAPMAVRTPLTITALVIFIPRCLRLCGKGHNILIMDMRRFSAGASIQMIAKGKSTSSTKPISHKLNQNL